MAVARFHRILGSALLIFIFSHLAVHLTALAGPEWHNAALRFVQRTYRNPIIEPLLLIGLGAQMVAGLTLAVRRWRQPGKDGWAKLQLASGFYLAYFIINHSSAALYTRYVGGLDTNFWWVSGPLLHPLLKYWFYPYYALAVLSIALHIGAVLHYRGRERAARTVSFAAAPVILAYWVSFGGWINAVPAHPAYRALYDSLLASLLP